MEHPAGPVPCQQGPVPSRAAHRSERSTAFGEAREKPPGLQYGLQEAVDELGGQLGGY